MHAELTAEVEGLRQAVASSSSQEHEELQKALQLLAEAHKEAAEQRTAFEQQAETDRQRYEAAYHQAVGDAQTRHQQVDAQNDDLRAMIGDLQQKVQQLENKSTHLL